MGKSDRLEDLFWWDFYDPYVPQVRNLSLNQIRGTACPEAILISIAILNPHTIQIRLRGCDCMVKILFLIKIKLQLKKSNSTFHETSVLTYLEASICMCCIIFNACKSPTNSFSFFIRWKFAHNFSSHSVVALMSFKALKLNDECDYGILTSLEACSTCSHPVRQEVMGSCFSHFDSWCRQFTNPVKQYSNTATCLH